MKKLTFSVFLFIAVVTFLLVGCDNHRVFEDYHQINKRGWHKDSLVVFQFPVTDSLQNHNLYINVRNDLNYNYQNLWFFISIKQPGNIAVTDTFEVLLATASGKWLGEGFGGIKEIQKEYRNNVFFPLTGIYEVSLQHGMRNDWLEGIHDIGFRVEKSD